MRSCLKQYSQSFFFFFFKIARIPEAKNKSLFLLHWMSSILIFLDCILSLPVSFNLKYPVIWSKPPGSITKSICPLKTEKNMRKENNNKTRQTIYFLARVPEKLLIAQCLRSRVVKWRGRQFWMESNQNWSLEDNRTTAGSNVWWNEVGQLQQQQQKSRKVGSSKF